MQECGRDQPAKFRRHAMVKNMRGNWGETLRIGTVVKRLQCFKWPNVAETCDGQKTWLSIVIINICGHWLVELVFGSEVFDLW